MQGVVWIEGQLPQLIVNAIASLRIPMAMQLYSCWSHCLSIEY